MGERARATIGVTCLLNPRQNGALLITSAAMRAKQFALALQSVAEKRERTTPNPESGAARDSVQFTAKTDRFASACDAFQSMRDDAARDHAGAIGIIVAQ